MDDTASTEAPASVVVAGDGTVAAPAPAAPPAAPKPRAKRTPTTPVADTPTSIVGEVAMSIRTF